MVIEARRCTDALERYDRAPEIGDRHQRARAHVGQGHADPASARRCRERALAVHTDLDVPQVERVRALRDPSTSDGSRR